jgi:hypothetical protein
LVWNHITIFSYSGENDGAGTSGQSRLAGDRTGWRLKGNPYVHLTDEARNQASRQNPFEWLTDEGRIQARSKHIRFTDSDSDDDDA